MSLLDKLNALLAGLTPSTSSASRARPIPAQPAQPAQPVVLEPAVIVSPRVLIFVYDPIMNPATGQKLSQVAGWHRPEDLVGQFVGDLLETSGGLVRYQIVKRIEINEFPVKEDGFRYTPAGYLSVMNRTAPGHSPDTVNYQDFLTRYKILQLVAGNQIDEIWIFGFPYAGFYESILGGAGAFFCNSDPLPNTAQCARRFAIMGFSYERGVGEMLESFGHRVEFTMNKVYSHLPDQNNLWKKYIRYDKVFPGQAEVGSIHFAPNSQQDYEWGNPRYVPSRCEDWYNFPNFKGTVKQVNCVDWGGGDIRAHHKWWLKHLPKVGGKTNGIANNWWQYVTDLNRVPV
jgi:hypothetical protein